ncbi:glycosylphosphatidylinositol anchor biosynthesis [Sporothrix epigloea]|uniref:Glycosylphosphatidylinositol anchor biosynthesis n=1 Tax=Sporothrix epigloea TaxID=1892477 RepID=A0ABP0DWF5_9PEZI
MTAATSVFSIPHERLNGPPPPSLSRHSTVPASLRSTSNQPAASLSANANTNGPASRRTDPYHLAPEDAFHSSVLPPWDRTTARKHNTTAATGSVSGSDLIEGRSEGRQTLRPSGLSSSSLRHSASAALLNGLGGGGGGGRGRSRGEGRSRSRRRRKRTWKKLLWVKQSYPDNYTDQATFLENLQRNPRLQPYEFWPLVADSTVIVQHVCSVIIFVICFAGISQDRVSPESVAGSGTIVTCISWLFWEWWAGQEQQERRLVDSGDEVLDGRFGEAADAVPSPSSGPQVVRRSHGASQDESEGGSRAVGSLSVIYPTPVLTLEQQALQHNTVPTRQSASASSRSEYVATPTADLLPSLAASTNSSTTSLLHLTSKGRTNANGRALAADGSTRQPSIHTSLSPVDTDSLAVGSMAGASRPASSHRPTSSHGRSGTDHQLLPATPGTPHYPPPRRSSVPLRGGRMHHRIATIKSAVLIYFTLLGLSPILKSLTRSTSSDSIWAMSFWLLTINIFFFDYSGVWVGAHKFPVASLSTNAALMASTVLASRLPSTGQVFSLTLFSIEVFGLFPVFRRYARHRSWRYHVGLTVLLVLGAGAGVGIILTEPGAGLPWRGATAGMVVACLLSAVAMGGCSWWLIGLQKYKNEIYGPWDPARPVIISRRHWNDM